MTARSGRRMRFKQGSTGIIGAQTDNLTINGELVDVTDKDDDGARTYLEDEYGVKSVDANIEGVVKDDVLIAKMFGSGPIADDYTVDIEGVGEIAARFIFSNVEIGAEHDGAITFTAQANSSGPVTYTPNGGGS